MILATRIKIVSVFVSCTNILISVQVKLLLEQSDEEARVSTITIVTESVARGAREKLPGVFLPGMTSKRVVTAGASAWDSALPAIRGNTNVLVRDSFKSEPFLNSRGKVEQARSTHPESPFKGDCARRRVTNKISAYFAFHPR